MTRTGAEARPPVQEERAETILEWIELHTRHLVIATVILLAVAGGLWFWIRSREIRAARAQEGLTAAEQSLQQGNLPLATSDLERLLGRYGSTPAAPQAALLLGQIYFERGEYQRGISVLERAVQTDAGELIDATFKSLIADGYDELGRYSEAAEHYNQAADLTEFETDRALYRASAARALTRAGNDAEALRIWSDLADNPESPVAGEARIRMGELTIQSAGR
ncbi:MAG: tetratricopeptide repeat protein [Gemmatimonadaceae bacterium]